MPGSALMALSQPEKDVTDPLTGLLWSGGAALQEPLIKSGASRLW